MITEKNIIKGIEDIRIKKNIKIQDLVDGIVSRRNYSRYLSGELSIQYDVLLKMLERLKIPFREFVYFILNELEIVTENETDFLFKLFDELYDEAYDSYLKNIKDKELYGYHRNAILSGIIYIKFLKNEISKIEANKYLQELLNIDMITKNYILEDDYILSLYFYTRICDKNLQEIKEYLVNAVTSNKYKIFTVYYEKTYLTVYLLILDILANKMEYSEENNKQLFDILKKALEFDSRAKYKTFDNRIFTVIHDYCLKNDIQNKYINYYYLASIFSGVKDNYIKNKKFKISKQDIDDFKECLKDKKFLEEPMYWRLLNE